MIKPCIIVLFDIIALIILLWRRIPLWIVFLIIASLTALAYSGLHGLLKVYYQVSIEKSTWDLVVIMFLISIFVSLYRGTGFIDKLSNELTLLFKKPRIVLMFVPAILGLLPVPGGALMSAPVVDRVGDQLGLDRVKKLFINVWFRHVIFVVYPLSTVLIMTAILTNTDLWMLIIRQIPIALAMIMIGYFIGFPRKGLDKGSVVEGVVDKIVLLKTFSPIIVTITIALSTSKILDYRYPLPLNRLSMVLAVSTGIVLLMIFSNQGIKQLVNIIRSREVVELTLIGYGAMLLRGAFNLLDLSCITTYLPLENPLLLIVAIPIFFSLIAGVISSSIALSISIITSITSVGVEAASLIYLSAFMGYLGSPLHLCYIYTAQYLKTSIVKGYKYMVPAILITLTLAIIEYIIL